MRTGIALGLFLAFAAYLFSVAAKADEVCKSRVEQIAEAEALPAIIAVKELNASETANGLAAVVTSDKPERDNIREGLLLLINDGRIILLAWMKDDSCGHALVPPNITEKMMQAIVRTGA